VVKSTRKAIIAPRYARNLSCRGSIEGGFISQDDALVRVIVKEYQRLLNQNRSRMTDHG
jgi:hypothetical protein